MKKLLAFLLPMLFIALIAVKSNNKTTQETAEIPQNIEEIKSEKEQKVEVLKKFFSLYKSPLIDHAETFVETADKYNINYKIMPAISCIESTCGKHIIKDSYNPFGWGITSKGHIAFKDFDEAIKKVGEGLNKGYFSKGLDTISEIAPIYTPPNPIHWESSVNYFIYKMDEIEKEYKEEELKDRVLNYL